MKIVEQCNILKNGYIVIIHANKFWTMLRHISDESKLLLKLIVTRGKKKEEKSISRRIDPYQVVRTRLFCFGITEYWVLGAGIICSVENAHSDTIVTSDNYCSIPSVLHLFFWRIKWKCRRNHYHCVFHIFDDRLSFRVSKETILYSVIEKEITQDEIYRSYAYNWWVFVNVYIQAIMPPSKI